MDFLLPLTFHKCSGFQSDSGFPITTNISKVQSGLQSDSGFPITTNISKVHSGFQSDSGFPITTNISKVLSGYHRTTRNSKFKSIVDYLLQHRIRDDNEITCYNSTWFS